jgi:hypothetical protein
MEKRPDLKPVPRSRSNFFRGLAAGLLSGVVWGAIVSILFYVNVMTNKALIIANIIQAEANYTTTQTINTTLSSTTIQNSVTTFVTHTNITGTSSPDNYIFNTTLQIIPSYIVLGMIFGVVIGLIFTFFSRRFLTKYSMPIRGIALALIFWLLYIVAIVGVGSADIYSIISSLLTSVASGFVLGFLFQRFGGGNPPEVMQPPPPATVNSG